MFQQKIFLVMKKKIENFLTWYNFFCIRLTVDKISTHQFFLIIKCRLSQGLPRIYKKDEKNIRYKDYLVILLINTVTIIPNLKNKITIFSNHRKNNNLIILPYWIFSEEKNHQARKKKTKAVG